MIQDKTSAVANILDIDRDVSIAAMEATLTADHRPILLDAFDAAQRWLTVRDWDRLVRICEALAIVGWGERDALTAVSGRFENSYFVRLHDALNADRGRRGLFRKRKAGLFLDHYFDADLGQNPTEATRLCESEINYIQQDKPTSQRNSVPMCQIGVVLYLDSSTSWGRAVSSILATRCEALNDTLIRNVDAAPLWPWLQSIFLGVHVDTQGGGVPGFAPNAFYRARKTFGGKLVLQEADAAACVENIDRKVADACVALLDALAPKLEAADAKAALGTMRRQTERELSDWMAEPPS